MASSGFLVAVEGGEGAGKTTQAARLAGELAAELSREPGGTELGEHVRMLLLDPGGDVDPRAELLLMLAARAQHVAERIEPWLAAGRTVVVDRFAGSTLAYQGYGRGLPLDEVRAACELAAAGRWPDLTVLLDVDAATAGRRSGGRTPDRIEAADPEFHERVREGFRRLAAAEPTGWVVVDAGGDPDEVARRVLEAVRARMATR